MIFDDIRKIWDNRKLVLGMNERNIGYIQRYNSRKTKAVADNKLKTKEALAKASIPTPKLLGVINDHSELAEFHWDKLPSSFVIKPVFGLEGGGIEIFFNQDKNGNWIKADGSKSSLEDIINLASDIVDGKYALHNQPDKVFFEERIKLHKAFKYYSYKGVPDVRIIVFNSVPVMAMLRLPTKESGGRGNLALGAVGTGIDIATGVTTTSIIGKDEQIYTVPGTNLPLSGLKIPYWEKILTYAIGASRATGLKFASVDFLIDRENGPLIVEMNARPGLSIQLANQDGLRWRLTKTKGVKIQSTEKGVRLGKDLFGGEIEEDIERISGRSLIGIYEDTTIYEKTLEPKIIAADKEISSETIKKLAKIDLKAKIDTGADSTSIDAVVATKLGYEEEIELFEKIKKQLNVPYEFKNETEAVGYSDRIDELLKEYDNPNICGSVPVRSSHGRSLRLIIYITLNLGGFIFRTRATVFNRSQLEYKLIVGRKSLSRFLVDPTKKTSKAALAVTTY